MHYGALRYIMLQGITEHYESVVHCYGTLWNITECFGMLQNVAEKLRSVAERYGAQAETSLHSVST